MNPIKCPHCGKIFFDIGSTICSFCKKNIEIIPNIFESKNPLNDLFDNFGGKQL